MARCTLNSFAFSVLILYLSTLVLGQGTQFITGTCSSDGDCASQCCGFRSGKCEGAVVAQERAGCGFGDSSPNDNAAVALGFTGTAPTGSSSGSTSSGSSSGATSGTGMSSSGGMSGSGSSSSSDGSSSSDSTSTSAGTNGAGNAPEGSSNKGAGNGVGAQFITGSCTGDIDCASGCCGFNTGKCAGAVIAQERDGGCGFGDSAPNDIAAQAFRSSQRRWAAYDYRAE